MKRCGKIAVCLAAGLALDAVSRAGDVAPADNPYALIVTRNVFSLNPPPPVDTTQPAEPAVKITPNGIMSIFGQFQVLFKTSGGGKPGEQSYILGEGQGQDEIDVVKIDEKAGIVTFKNHGTVQELPLASTSANGGATTPGQPAAAFNPASGFQSTAPGVGNSGRNGFTVPPVNGGANNPAGRNLGGGQSGANNGAQRSGYTTPQSQNTMDPDVQQVL